MSAVSTLMVKCHKDSGMHGPLILKMVSEETKRIREWITTNVPGETVWWCDRDEFHLMATTDDLLVQIKLTFMDPQ